MPSIYPPKKKVNPVAVRNPLVLPTPQTRDGKKMMDPPPPPPLLLPLKGNRNQKSATKKSSRIFC